MLTSTLKNDSYLIQSAHLPVRCAADCEPEILTQIYNPDISLCILKRSIDSAIKTYSIFLQQARSNLHIARIISLNKLFDDLVASLPEHPLRSRFIDDVQVIAGMFCCLFELERIGFRLCVLDKTMYPRFHTDKVPCRLITTYTGPGTEWLDRQVNDLSILNTCDACIPYVPFIHALNEGDIALFKGDRWEENGPMGVIHCSPAINVNETRLLLTLDFAD